MIATRDTTAEISDQTGEPEPDWWAVAGIAVLIASLLVGALVSILHDRHGEPATSVPAYPAARKAAETEFPTGGIPAAIESGGTPLYETQDDLEEVRDYFSSGPGAWLLEREVPMSDGQVALYLTHGETIAVVRIMTEAAYRDSSLSDGVAGVQVEADGTVIVTSLIECLEPGGITECLDDLAGR